MKASQLLWLSLAVASPASARAGFFSNLFFGSDNREELYATVNNNTIHDVIHKERRYVLFNSRSLAGECIDVCVPDRNDKEVGGDTRTPTASPTVSPTKHPTASPTVFPTKHPTASPTVSPTKEPTALPTKSPTASPTVSPTKEPTALPTKGPTLSPTKEPTMDPTKSPTLSPTDLPDPAPPVPTPGIDCETLVNLGYEFSAASNYNGVCYPAITSLQAGSGPFSQTDDHVAIFVGGDFTERKAAEVEGKVVTLGNLIVESKGSGNFVSVGLGSHVIPSTDTDCIIVGGALEAYKNIQVYNQASWMKCNIVYKGAAKNKNKWKTNGSVRQDPNLDLSFYKDMRYVFEKKSKYWKTLESTGTFSDFWGETRLECSNKNEIQVFNFYESDRSFLSEPHTFNFGDDCEGKTILINVHGDGMVNVNAAAMRWKGRQGYNAGGFPTCMTESILWNFPDADSVDIGNGKTSEFHGSILAVGDVIVSTSGQSGRTIVLGDLMHDSGCGSEFHSYDFNPPIPLPDPDDICVFPDDPEARSYGAVAPYPTTAPTNSPTLAPTEPLGECLAIPQEDLPHGSWATKDKKCRKCYPGSHVHWYPCNKNPPICHGNCQLFL